jgi:hypothetical protein
VTSGTVAGLYLAGAAGEPMRAVPEAQAVAGKGLEGDRYFLRPGTFTDDPKRGCQVTLIALRPFERAGPYVISPVTLTEKFHGGAEA